MFKPNDYVWCCYEKTFWPGIIIDPVKYGLELPKENYFWVFWFGDNRWSKMSIKNIRCFTDGFSKYYSNLNRKSKTWRKAVIICIREYGCSLTKDWTDEQLVKWATDGLVTSSPLRTDTPDIVKEKLGNILGMPDKLSADLEQKQLIKKCLKDFNLYESYSFCFGCYTRGPTEEHPIFAGMLCKRCKDELKLTLQSYGEDGIMNYCIVCARPGNTIVCSSIECGRAFCYICMDDLASTNATSEILKMEEWYCFICETNKKYCGLLQVRSDWKEKVDLLFRNLNPPIVMPPPPVPLLSPKRRIRVLSLFDGIGTALFTLKKLNIPVDVYYRSEIDNAASLVVRTNYPKENIINLHDIKTIDRKVLHDITPIDLVLGGSPCNDLSMANPNRKGLYDPTGTGVLFFEFFRILSILKDLNENFFWLFENVSSMPVEYKSEISRFLQCEPTLIDAVNLSPQKRQRLFWGNLRALEKTVMEGDGPSLNAYLCPNRTATVTKLRTITTKSNSLVQGPKYDKSMPILDSDSGPDTPWIVELERIFGFKEHYTDVNISLTTRQTLIGKAFSVQTLEYLLRDLKQYFETVRESARER